LIYGFFLASVSQLMDQNGIYLLSLCCTFKCIHFIDGERTVTDFKDTKPGQARARQYLFNQLMEFLDEGNTPFKIKVKDFFENFKLTRLSDRLHNDIDDELLFVLLDDMNVSRVPRD
jgi:hypothetical protein